MLSKNFHFENDKREKGKKNGTSSSKFQIVIKLLVIVFSSWENFSMIKIFHQLCFFDGCIDFPI
jgi:hypothetical protein